MMNLLYYLSFGLPLFILIGEVVAIIYLSRKMVERRLLYVLASYLSFVTFAAFLAYPGDEFGYSFLPVLLITGPWYFILEETHVYIPFLKDNIVGIILLGTTLNCMILYAIDRLSSPKHTAKFLDQHAT